MRAKLVWKITILAVCITLIMSVVGCGSNQTPSPVATEVPVTQTTESVESATELAPEPVTISVWYIPGPGQDWIPNIAVPQFEQESPNIKVELVGYPENEYGLKIETAVAANETPDIAVLVLFNAPRVVPAGALLDLAPYMEQSGLKKTDFCPSIDSRFNVLNDTLYALPMDTNIWAMMYNKDLFSGAGLPELSADTYITYDDWLEYSKAITKVDQDLNKYVWGSALFWPRWNSMNNYMSSPFFLGDDGRTALGNSETEDWVRFYENTLSAYTEGLMPESASTAQASLAANDLFNQGRLGMVYGTLGNAIAARNAGINVGLTGQPVITEGWEGNVGSWETSWSIFSGSQHPQEAWEFIQFLAKTGALTVAQSEAGYASAAMPCYIPAQETFIKGSENDPLVQDAITLLGHVQNPPWTVDAWASSTPFEEAWRRITEDNVDIPTALHDAALQSQDTTDGLWADWDSMN